ncbi:uncharacterized protein LOC132555467 [Ylistrum balloti]|uniref:uncharacterized protein LOC132555467 n=1 Tax=Ylistrum balloti TaxID=509963 RepID=UPI002905A69E|nr:uncharacterized protein LOC132555467 [Ylistrum balloti]
MSDYKPSKPKLASKERYRDTLDVISKARYDQKISIIGGKDPYELTKSEWSDDVHELPAIAYPDIVNYLVNTQSAYTLDNLKAYKSLESYNYFVSGWVRDLGSVKMDNDLRLISARVRHSQCMNDSPLHPWLMAENNGKVMAAHCNCMAGLGESCSHVGALMFARDASVKLKRFSDSYTRQGVLASPFLS